MTKDPHSLIATIKAYLHAVFVSLKKTLYSRVAKNNAFTSTINLYRYGGIARKLRSLFSVCRNLWPR